MKSIMLGLTVFFTLNLSAFAGSKITCPDEILRCELRKLSYEAPRLKYHLEKVGPTLSSSFQASKSENECVAAVYAYEPGVASELIAVEISDKTMDADIYIMEGPHSDIVPGGALIPVTINRVFIYVTKKYNIRCELSK
jgi:hypothetical protein